MKKRHLGVAAIVIMATVVLAGCGKDNSVSDVTTVDEAVEAESVEAMSEANTDEAASEETGSEEDGQESDVEKSPLVLWEYEGYVDDCEEYYWQDEFKDCDYDSDGTVDRVDRKWDSENEIAKYTIEFGNGDKLVVPDGWETGFPHVQGADLDGDDEMEILVTLTYDTSTDPMSFGDMWLFDKNTSGEYEEVALPLVSGENGARGFVIDFDAPDGEKVTFKIKDKDFSMDAELDEEYLTNYWSKEATTDQRYVYWADAIEDGKPHIRCFIEPFFKNGLSLGFDLVYKDGKYVIENIEEDTHEF